ncbi:hypothetical protein [Neobacillus vireti]|uniref:hypothetical protein n=1 Tax=Neobacillus vireti TaxID=220686 RepID=UPI003000AA89
MEKRKYPSVHFAANHRGKHPGAGFIFDWFSVHMLFYLAGAWYIVHSWLALKRNET